MMAMLATIAPRVVGQCCDHILSMHDSYGDGIYAPGGYWLYIDGALATSGNAFGSQATFQFNCPPGAYCTGPLPINTGTYTTLFDDSWYFIEGRPIFFVRFIDAFR